MDKNVVHHHGPLAAEIPVPHGVQDYDTINGQIVEDSEISDGAALDSKDEKAIFSYLLRPDDSYDENGTYWADMKFGQKVSFVTKVNNAEAKRELGNLWTMFKNDPLSPVSWYFRDCVIPGAGLLLEGYVLFSIGNVTPLFQKVWPTCWKSGKVCNNTWIAATTYLEVCGIIVGQIMVGLIGDSIGRRFGLIQDSVIMFLGLIMLTASWGVTLNGWVICYAWSLFFYSVGVGGEYPMTATSGMENGVGSGKVSTKQDRLHRGRKVLMAFLMQGWGQFLNQGILILLLLVFHHGSGNPPYSEIATQWTFRVSFAIPALGTLWLVYYRYYKMPAASKQLALAKKKAKVTGYDMESLKLTFTYFGPRMIATCIAWFANDVFFYGNKLFQSQFIAVISPTSTSVMEGWLYNLVNVGVSLCGYYLAAFLIDNKLYGRKKMMIVGFLMDFILFIVPGFHYKYYTEKTHITAFQAMYFLSSFFNQFGPNSVTFLVAAEVFPTSIRATAHGIAAACGKLGALMAGVLYNYITTQQKFYVVPWFGLLGMIVTLLFMPDTTGLDLKEQDRRWQFIRAGSPQDYHGVAVHPKHLSWWERFRGVGKYYDSVADYVQKVHEMKKDWEAKQASKFEETEKLAYDDDDTEFSDEVRSYLEKNSPVIKPMK
ncbi:major facilitator superfamily domain-containing protein [Lipomyces starkeyi]